MSELIDKKQLWDRIYALFRTKEQVPALVIDEHLLLLMIEQTPPENVVPAVHAYWYSRGGRACCSHCNVKALWSMGYDHNDKEFTSAETPYCPNCGARMDGSPKSNPLEKAEERGANTKPVKKIWTSYFARNGSHPNAVSIARIKPRFVNCRENLLLAPPEGLLWNYKNGRIDEKQYTDFYIAMLENIGFETIDKGLSDGDVLLCYEKYDKFCHRHILAKWLRQHGYEVAELMTDGKAD